MGRPEDLKRHLHSVQQYHAGLRSNSHHRPPPMVHANNAIGIIVIFHVALGALLGIVICCIRPSIATSDPDSYSDLALTITDPSRDPSPAPNPVSNPAPNPGPTPAPPPPRNDGAFNLPRDNDGAFNLPREKKRRPQ